MDKNKRLTHGTLSGYQDFRCRCKKCADVWALYLQEFRNDIYDETKGKIKPLRVQISDRDYSERREDNYQ